MLNSLEQRRIVVTGIGVVTSLGIGVEPTWKNLINGQSGITSVDCQTDLEMSPFKRFRNVVFFIF